MSSTRFSPDGGGAAPAARPADLAVALEVMDAQSTGLAAMRAALSAGPAASPLAAAFIRAVDIIAALPGRVITSGIGKSGHVARKVQATLASTGTPASFVHPSEASHGDLGMVLQGDAVIALSNSGETAELADLVAHTRRFAIPLLAITSRPESTLARAADIVLALPPAAEACPVTAAPTTSTTMQMMLGDALAVALLLLGAIAVWPEINRQITLASETARDVAAVRRDSGRMLSPHYAGIDSHDRPYTITAASARQMGQNRIDLDAPVMDMSSGTGWVLLQADRGTYMQDSNILALTGHVTLYRDDGVIATSPAADVDLRGDVIASQDWIHADGPFGILDAQGYMLAQNAGVAQFAGPARLVLNNDHVAQAPQEPPAPHAAAGTIAGTRNPTQPPLTPHASHAHGHAHRKAGPHRR